MTDPVVVFRTHSAMEASIVRGLLEAHGYDAMLTPDTVWAIVPPTTTDGAEVSVAVPAAVADGARRLVESRRDEAPGGGDEPSLGEAFAGLEVRLGHRFMDRALLEHALTHRSRAHEDVTGGVVDNESLEFLGDAVVGLVIAEALYRTYPDLDEGAKSKIRASLVSAGRLARLGESLALGDHLLLGRGEEKTGGRRKTALLADACEAVVAAIYLDAGMQAAAAFVHRELWEPFEAAGGGRAAALAAALDYKSALQEALQARGLGLPEYRVLAERGPEHDKEFEVEVRAGGEMVATAIGRSKKDAEQQAARQALQMVTE
jgi:ribonuclease-3